MPSRTFGTALEAAIMHESLSTAEAHTKSSFWAAFPTRHKEGSLFAEESSMYGDCV